MAKVVNSILGLDCVIGIEIDLKISSRDGIERALKEIEKIEAKKGMLLLVDMGSLVILGDEIERRYGIRCKTISRVDTLLAIEVTKSALIQNKSLDVIIEGLQQNKNYSFINANNQNYRENAQSKKPIVVAICLSGIGTALRLKEQIEKRLKDVNRDIEVRALGLLQNINLEEELRCFGLKGIEVYHPSHSQEEINIVFNLNNSSATLFSL